MNMNGHHYTLLHGKVINIVEYLVSHGANINVTNLSGFTLLHIACRYGYKDIVKYLISHGAKC